MATPYRLLLDADQWKNLADRLRDPVHATIARTNRQALELLHRFPPGSPDIHRRLDDPGSESVAMSYRIVKIRLVRGAVAWWLEGREQDAEDLRLAVDHFLGESWGISESMAGSQSGIRHFDLRTGDLSWCAAFALDVLPEVLGPERVAALQRRLVEEMLPAYLRGISEGDWWRACDFNWGAATHGNAGFAALAIEEDHPELAATVLKEAKAGLQPLLAALPAGGAWIEGMMYQSTALGHLTDFVAALQRVHGDDLGLTANRRLRDCVSFRREQLGGDGRPLNFSNCNEDNIEWYLPQAWWWARHFADPSVTSFEDTHIKPWWDMHGIFHDVEAFWYREAGQAAVERTPARFHRFDDLDWVSWRGKRWWLALRGGQLGGNHGNLDLGQIILGSGAKRWLVDPGYGAGKTDQHNLPTIRGKDQTDGARGQVLRIVDGPDLHLAVDLQEAHPHVLDRWIRHLLVLDDHVVVVIDDLLGKGARRLSARFQLQVRGTVTLDGDLARSEQEGATLSIRVQGPHCGLIASPWSFAGRDLTTVSWRPRPDLPAAIQAVTLCEQDVSVAIRHQDGWTQIEVGGRRWRLDRSALRLERLDG